MLKKYWPYILVFGGLFGALVFFNGQRKPEIRWSKTYKNADKIPFGCNALFRILDDGSFDGNFVSKKTPLMQIPTLKKTKNTTYFFLTDRLFFDQFEAKKLFDFADSGNTVFLCANHFMGEVKDTFDIETQTDIPFLDEKKGALDTADKKKFGVNYLNPYLKNKEKYFYDHLISYSSFSRFDTTRMSVIAADDSGRAVMLRANIGKGKIYFFSLPDVFSNYYLVNHPSRFFAYKALSFLNNETLWWDEYYKTANPRETNPFRFFIENDSLYVAFWMAIWATLFFMFFGMKRSQRPVPIVTPPVNSTLQFVEVVGNVYFSAKNHKIIAQEKIMIFLEFVRSKFMVKTENITEEDLQQISRLSGLALTQVKELFANIKYIYTVEHLNEAELLQFNKRIEDFYKNNKR